MKIPHFPELRWHTYSYHLLVANFSVSQDTYQRLIKINQTTEYWAFHLNYCPKTESQPPLQLLQKLYNLKSRFFQRLIQFARRAIITVYAKGSMYTRYNLPVAQSWTRTMRWRFRQSMYKNRWEDTIEDQFSTNNATYLTCNCLYCRDIVCFLFAYS